MHFIASGTKRIQSAMWISIPACSLGSGTTTTRLAPDVSVYYADCVLVNIGNIRWIAVTLFYSYRAVEQYRPC